VPVVPPTAGDYVLTERVAETASVLVVRGNVVKIDVLRNAIQLCDGANRGRQTIHELPHDRVMFVDVIAATADKNYRRLRRTWQWGLAEQIGRPPQLKLSLPSSVWSCACIGKVQAAPSKPIVIRVLFDMKLPTFGNLN
jgi:hypothetical protein